MQLCPQLMNLPLTAPLEAFSISASPQTMKGSLPPNSSTHFFHCPVALEATLAPTETLPVNVTPFTSESINTSAVLESPTTVLNTPLGRLIFLNEFSISIPHWSVALAGLRTIVLPAIKLGAANLSACQYGKFQGIMLPITPKGWNMMILFLASVLRASSFRKIGPLSP